MDGIVLPLLDIGDLLPLKGLWDSASGFIVLYTTFIGAIGVGSKNLAVGALGAFLAFVYLSINADITFFENLAYVAITTVIIGVGFKFWRLEGMDA